MLQASSRMSELLLSRYQTNLLHVSIDLYLFISCLFSSLRRLASVQLTYSFFSINVVFIPHFALAQITSPTCHALPLATCYILRDTPGSNLRTILSTGFFLIFPGLIPSSSRQQNFLFESHIQHFMDSWVLIYYFVKLSSLIVTSRGRWYTSLKKITFCSCKQYFYKYLQSTMLAVLTKEIV